MKSEVYGWLTLLSLNLRDVFLRSLTAASVFVFLRLHCCRRSCPPGQFRSPLQIPSALRHFFPEKPTLAPWLRARGAASLHHPAKLPPLPVDNSPGLDSIVASVSHHRLYHVPINSRFAP